MRDFGKSAAFPDILLQPRGLSFQALLPVWLQHQGLASTLAEIFNPTWRQPSDTEITWCRAVGPHLGGGCSGRGDSLSICHRDLPAIRQPRSSRAVPHLLPTPAGHAGHAVALGH